MGKGSYYLQLDGGLQMQLIRITGSSLVSTVEQDQDSHCATLLPPYGCRKEDTAGKTLPFYRFHQLVLRQASSDMAVCSDYRGACQCPDTRLEVLLQLLQGRSAYKFTQW